MTVEERGRDPYPWTPEKVDELIELWNSGLSGTVIARRLGARSRSTVLGKVSRLRLNRRRHQKSWTTTEIEILKRRRAEGYPAWQIAFELGRTQISVIAKSQELRLVADLKINLPRLDAPEPQNIPLLDLLPFHCREVTTSGHGTRPALFCGHPTIPESSYCAFHHGVNHRPMPKGTKKFNRRIFSARTGLYHSAAA